MRWKTVLVDDERRSLETMQWLLEECCPEVEITGMYDSPLAALAALRQSPPDLLFLDIAMPGLNGFDLLRQLLPLSFSIIFVTAYNGPTVRALKNTGLPFLLKPVDEVELTGMISRLHLQPAITDHHLEILQGFFQTGHEGG